MPGAGEAREKQKKVFGVFRGLWDYFPWEFHFTHTIYIYIYTHTLYIYIYIYIYIYKMHEC